MEGVRPEGSPEAPDSSTGKVADKQSFSASTEFDVTKKEITPMGGFTHTLYTFIFISIR
jgi:hypothetical protein